MMEDVTALKSNYGKYNKCCEAKIIRILERPLGRK